MDTLTPTNQTTSGGAAAGGGDPTITAIANAVGALADMTVALVQPGIIAASYFYQQLVAATPRLQNPFADINANRRQTDTILIFAGVGIIVVLIIAIVIKKRKQDR